MDIVSYLYYKGFIYTAINLDKKALESFNLVLSMPTTILHEVHSEAFKKMILL